MTGSHILVLTLLLEGAAAGAIFLMAVGIHMAVGEAEPDAARRVAPRPVLAAGPGVEARA